MAKRVDTKKNRAQITATKPHAICDLEVQLLRGFVGAFSDDDGVDVDGPFKATL